MREETHDCYSSAWFVSSRDNVGLGRCGKCRRRLSLWRALGVLTGRVRRLERREERQKIARRSKIEKRTRSKTRGNEK